MQRYFSVGVTKLAALMAAHRLAAGENGMTPAAFRAELARIDAELKFANWRAQKPPGQPKRQQVSVVIRKEN